jgi:signal transduction histidine kinase
LPSRSIVLYAWQRYATAEESVLQTYDILALIAKSSSAPIYGMGSRNIGYGIVGGYVQDSERNGLEVAEVVRRILNGTRAQDIPVDSAASILMFDWRQLQRWRINESSLPNESIIKFKELTLWQQYKWRITGILLLFFLQSSIIGLLLIERKRRQRAREALAQLNTELEQRITARTAALNAKSKELETFAYSVAHDLKAPLRGIEGYSRLLLEEHTANLNEEARTFVKTIRSSSEEMDQLIEDLLDYSRMERRELKTDRIELRTFVNSVVDQKKVEAAARGVDITIDVNGGFVHGDLNGLSQAFKNYLDNAIKFSKDSADPRIEIGADETERSCRLWVRDNGLGFDMKYKDRIFDIFERLNRSEDYPGTGIGLAIVRRAMERMGGKAWGEGEPGRGAKFYLEIPK